MNDNLSMKTTLLQIVGAIVMLASIVFALLSLQTADHWVMRWLPFILAGAGLALVATILRKDGRHE
jgi:hypothetical protein